MSDQPKPDTSSTDPDSKPLQETNLPTGWEKRDVKNPSDAKEVMAELTELAADDKQYLCRGEPKLYDTGKPSVARFQNDEKPLDEMILCNGEPHLVAHFRHRVGPYLSPSELELTRTVMGTLALMQHYNAPTRLLDWSLSPWIAAFFAAAEETNEDGYVFAFKLHHLTAFEKETQSKEYFDRLFLIQTLKEWRTFQKTFYNEKDETPKFDGVAAFHLMRATPRMIAQMSYFTIGFPQSLDQRKWLGENLNGNNRKRVVVIPSSAKQELLKILARMNLTASTLYPGLQGVGQSINDLRFNHKNTPPAQVDNW